MAFGPKGVMGPRGRVLRGLSENGHGRGGSARTRLGGFNRRSALRTAMIAAGVAFAFGLRLDAVGGPPGGTAVTVNGPGSHMRYVGGAIEGDFTIMAMFKIAVDRDAFSTFLIMGGPQVPPQLFRNSYSISTDYDGHTFRIQGTVANPGILGPELSVGAWHHLALVGNTAPGSLLLGYVDGVLAASGNGNAQGTYLPEMIEIGGCWGQGIYYLDGSFCALKAWNAKLTQTEIEAEMAYYRAIRTNVLWQEVPLRNTADLFDLSGNERHLVATGPAFVDDTDGPPLTFDPPTAAEACFTASCCPEGTYCECIVFTPLTDGTACDDELFCTVEDACTNGVCGGSPYDCSASSDSCNLGVCDEAADECRPQPLTDGTACDDELFCTVEDACANGVCGGSPYDCSASSDQCNFGQCNEASDECESQPVTDGTACDDELFCTVDDVCTDGACGGPPYDCSASADQCNTGVCNETTARCEAKPLADGTACDDELFCTVDDVCTNGVCGGSPYDCSASADQCNTGVCNETTDRCDAVPLSNGTACDDELFCTVDDVCTDGVCGGSPHDCSASADQCNTGVCNETIDQCEAQPKADGTSCDDGNPCSHPDRCQEGRCEGSVYGLSAWRIFHECLTGVGMVIAAGCECYDLDVDGYVDLKDAAEVTLRFAGD